MEVTRLVVCLSDSPITHRGQKSHVSDDGVLDGIGLDMRVKTLDITDL